MAAPNVYSVSHTCNKEKRDTLTSLKEGMTAVLISMQNIEDKSEPVKQQITTLTATQALIQEQINEVTEKIKITEDLQNAHQPQLKLPKFGSETTFKVEDAKIYCCSFGDKKDPHTLSEFWNKITTFTELQNLSEECVKKLLGCLLTSEAYLLFFNCRNKPLQDILQLLVDRFDYQDTLADHIQQLDSLRRRPSESITSFMARASELIFKTEISVPEPDRHSRKNHLMRELLMKFCSPKAKSILSYHSLLAGKNGFILSYNDSLDICKQAEQDEKPL